MATLVLTAVGTLVGGPVGGAIGAIIGQQADAAIFAPKRRQGPRLGDLAVQTSSYGTQIPRLFGSLRVAGTVIWATDLNESQSRSGGGKGRPGTTSYTYSASFAVALSGRPILGVRRIWADGKLLRGAAGDFKSETGYRLYLGTEEQMPDPLIASIEGIGQTPAFRGIAYALFEDLQLADFGNRIPSLTFEVEADAAPVTMGAIAAELSGGAVGAGETPLLGGYAGGGDSVRAAIEGMSEVAPLALAEAEDGSVLTMPSGDPILIDAAATGASAGGEDGRTEVSRIAAGAVAAEISIAYHDVDRDYQTGLQRAGLAAGPQRAERRAIPAALTADGAKALAEAKLKALRAARSTASVRAPWRLGAIRPGTLARIEGQSGVWKVERWTLERMVAKLDLVRVAEGTGAALVDASPGRPIGHADLLHGPTMLQLMDVPAYSELSADRPEILVAAAGAEPGWRRATLAASLDGGASWVAAGGTAGTAVMGVATTVLAPGGSALFDVHNAVEVELPRDAMWLEGRDEDALVGGANLALLGDELIQFGSVEPIGGRRFRLSRLLRGRRGTEWAAAIHQAGERFVLIEPEALTAVPAPLSAIGADIRVSARGIGDALPVEAAIAFAGESLRPPSPVHLRAERQANGDLAIDWVRRSRNGWAWIDGDTPLVEASELYRLRLAGPAGERVLQVQAPHFLYLAAEQTADGTAGAPLSIEVLQLGTVAASRPAALTVLPD